MKAKKVEKIELKEGKVKLRLVLTIVFLLIALFAFGYSVYSCRTVKKGWKKIDSEVAGADDFSFYYNVGQGELSATKEFHKVETLYNNSLLVSTTLLDEKNASGKTKNLHYINTHVGEEIQVDGMLYDALETILSGDNRYLYGAPLYDYYESVFASLDDAEAEGYLWSNGENADLLAEILSYTSSPDHVKLELLGNRTVKLTVSNEYASFIDANHFGYLSFFRLKNAFIVDYVADRMEKNGFTAGAISSYDGYTRILDKSGRSYSFGLFDRENGVRYHSVATGKLSARSAMVAYRNFPVVKKDLQSIYAFNATSAPSFYTAFADPTDGTEKTACPSLTVYQKSATAPLSCAKVAITAYRAYNKTSLESADLSQMKADGLHYVYCKDKTVYYTDGNLELDGLYSDGTTEYRKEIIG